MATPGGGCTGDQWDHLLLRAPAPLITSHDGVVKLLHHADHYLVICNIDFMLLY